VFYTDGERKREIRANTSNSDRDLDSVLMMMMMVRRSRVDDDDGGGYLCFLFVEYYPPHSL
jgi:hypothetical protein